MKIWLFHFYAIPPSLSGITRHYSLCKSLKKQGHEPLLIAASRHHRNHDTLIAGKENYKHETIDDVSFLWLKTWTVAAKSWKRIANTLLFLWRILCLEGLKKQPRPDIIVGCTPDPLTALGAYITARRFKVPFVLHIGDVWPLALVEIGGVSKYHPYILFLSWLEKFLYKKSDAIISCLPDIANYLAQQGFADKDLTIIPNGIDLNMFDLAYHAPTNDKPFIVMFCGAHGQSNGVDGVLDAAKFVQQKYDKDQISFHLIGEGSERERLIERAEKEKLHNIVFRPAVPKTEVPAILQEAHCFILNYINIQAFSQCGISPNKIFEYMATGRPTVLSCSAENHPIKESGAGLWVSANDTQALGQAVIDIFEMSDDKRAAMGQNGQKIIKEKYNFDRLAHEFAKTLKRTIKRK